MKPIFKKTLPFAVALLWLQPTNLSAQQDTLVELSGVTIFATQGVNVSVAGHLGSIREIPQSVSVITPRVMRELNLITLDQAMEQVTGVTPIVWDNMRSHYRTRGYDMTVMHDGLPSYNALAISQQLDLAFYQQIEVLRGPAGLLQGTPGGQNIGGVINLVKKTPHKDPLTSVLVSIGSWNNYRTEVDVNVPLNKARTVRSRWMVFGNDRNFFYERSHQSKLGAYGIVEWDVTPSTLLSASYSMQKARGDVVFMGLPASRIDGNDQSRNISTFIPRSGNLTPDWDWLKWNTQDLFFSAKQNINSNWSAELKTNIRTQSQEMKQGFPGTINTIDSTSGYERRRGDARYPRMASALDVTGKFRLFNQEHSVLAGFNIERFEDDNRVVNFPVSRFKWFAPELIPDIGFVADQHYRKTRTRIKQHGAYGQLRLSIIDPVQVILGGRMGSVKAEGYNFNDSTWVKVLEDKNRFTPFAGIVFSPTKQLTFYASYSDLFVPQVERKENGDMLDPRIGSNFEIGTKNELFNNRLNVNLAYFNIVDNGRAYRIAPGSQFFDNLGRVESKGLDVEITGKPFNRIEFTTGYTYLKTKIAKDHNKNIEGKPSSPIEPEHSFKFWGIYRHDKLSAGLGVMAFSPRWVNETPERRQGSYAIVNTFVSYTINSNFSLNLNLNNIFDKVYYARVGGNGDFFGEPRNITLGIRCRF